MLIVTEVKRTNGVNEPSLKSTKVSKPSRTKSSLRRCKKQNKKRLTK